MRIDRLEIENFKCFAKQTIDLHPQFTLFVGGNGSGKTSVLDALAVAASIWLVAPPDSTLSGSRRDISVNEIRLQPTGMGDHQVFVECAPVSIRASGQLVEKNEVSWSRRPGDFPGGRVIVEDGAASPFAAFYQILGLYNRDTLNVILPILAYYGAGRLSPPSGQQDSGPARRWAAFRDCLAGYVQPEQLDGWFRRETMARGNRGGRWRPGFEVVRRAIMRCLPGADDIWFDPYRDEIVVSIEGGAQPSSNLSAGQRMMMTLVADLAIRAVTQNAFLIPADELGPDDEPLPRVLRETPGIVLIDELDVHLHPRWQRRVASDLKATFPAIQFVCTSHSPQIIGELKPEEIRILDAKGVPHTPPRSFGLDSDRVLEELMDAPRRNRDVEASLRELFDLIDKEDFDRARDKLSDLEKVINEDDPELTRARALMSFLQSPI